MQNLFVLNSSPIISLSKAGLHIVLERLPVVIPQHVADELRNEKYLDEARQFIDDHQDNVISTYTISDELKNWGLGYGESSVLAIALQQQDWVAVLDDGQARKCAKVYNLKLTGTIGLLVIASKMGIINNLKDAIYSVKDSGFYLHTDLIENLLKKH